MKKHRIKNTLRAMASHLGIKVKFVHYLGNDIHGKLFPREKRILINAHKSRNEHIYTLLHEIGHYLVHFKNPKEKHHPRFFDINWKIKWLANLCLKVRRYFRFIFNKESGKEWEADLWAMCAFIYLARRITCRRELISFLCRHPEKRKVFLLVVVGTIYTDTKTGFQKMGRALAMPFKTV